MSNYSKDSNAASRFRHRIAPERPSVTQDSIGDTLVTWLRVDEVWADIEPRSTNERYIHQSLTSTVSHNVYIRYRDDVSSDWRIIYNSRIMHVTSVISVDERNEVSLLEVKEAKQ